MFIFWHFSLASKKLSSSEKNVSTYNNETFVNSYYTWHTTIANRISTKMIQNLQFPCVYSECYWTPETTWFHRKLPKNVGMFRFYRFRSAFLSFIHPGDWAEHISFHCTIFLGWQTDWLSRCFSISDYFSETKISVQFPTFFCIRLFPA